jgi:hypothetical protein
MPHLTFADHMLNFLIPMLIALWTFMAVMTWIFFTKQFNYGFSKFELAIRVFFAPAYWLVVGLMNDRIPF